MNRFSTRAAGATLTVGLILAELGWVGHAPQLCMFLMALGLISIHAERAFPPQEGHFARERFGMPLFWSGHVQLGLSLAILLGVQIIVGWAQLGGEGVIAVLALTAMAAIAFQSYLARANEGFSRAVPPLAMALSILPVLIGIGLHIRATSRLAHELNWSCQTGWWFVVVMVLVAACNRAAAYLYRRTAPKWSAAYFFLSAAALVVAAAGLLRTPMLDLTEWTGQAPLLMLIPLAYLVASRLWRGHSPEWPLYWVAQAATAVILVHVLAASQETLESLARPVQGQTANLLLGLVFAEAAVFYTLATIFRRRSVNVYFATAAACGALWQLLGYFDVPGAYHTMLYAVLGVGLLAVSRRLGLEQIPVYRSTGEQALATRGTGLPAFQTGNAVVSVALLAAFLQGLTRLATHATGWRGVFALSMYREKLLELPERIASREGVFRIIAWR